jgi:hypothetical protein
MIFVNDWFEAFVCKFLAKLSAELCVCAFLHAGTVGQGEKSCVQSNEQPVSVYRKGERGNEKRMNEFDLFVMLNV